MTLTKDNLTEWKKELDRAWNKIVPKEWHGLSKTLSDEEYLEDYIGEDIATVIRDNYNYLSH